jgi:hypothetical protein
MSEADQGHRSPRPALGTLILDLIGLRLLPVLVLDGVPQLGEDYRAYLADDGQQAIPEHLQLSRTGVEQTSIEVNELTRIVGQESETVAELSELVIPGLPCQVTQATPIDPARVTRKLV